MPLRTRLNTYTTQLRQINTHNLHTFTSQTLSEISGSLGDLGTFLPLLIALATITDPSTNNASSTTQTPPQYPPISLPTTLILTGLSNIATGILFGIPLPVQPMKAIAAIAISTSMARGEVMAAGIFVAAVIGLASATGILELLNRVVPVPVVKGVQVGAGLSLVVAAGSKALSSLTWTGPTWADNRLWMLGAFLALLASNLVGTRIRPLPFALLITLLGIIFASILTSQSPGHSLPHPGFNFSSSLTHWTPHVPTSPQWRTGILTAGLGQLPLTTLNSVVAVVALSADLLPHTPTPTVTGIGLSVAAMNLIGCWFGGMPVCHGSGGLAAQYRFGARSGASVVFLGVLKVGMGLVFGDSLVGLLDRFPIALLTVMVVAAGLELVGVGESLNCVGRARDLKGEGEGRGEQGVSERESKERWMVMMVTAGLLLAFKNDAVGFVAGMSCHWGYRVAHWLEGHGEGQVEDDDDDGERRRLLPG